jgi:hypothetical protein
MPREMSKTNELRVALETFAASSRYNVLKQLQIGRLMPEECGSFGELADMSLEKIVELGSERIAKLPYLTLMQEGSLVQLLHSLCSEEDMITAQSDENASSESEQAVSSVQIELALRERLRAICTHVDYAKVRTRTLGEFWDSRWTPAPFEEALRVEQLAGMDVSVLFKKRSVNDQRIQSICKALDKILDALAPVATPASEMARIAAARQPIAARTTVPVFENAIESSTAWFASDDVLQPTHVAIVEVFSLACVDTRYQELRALIHGVINRFTPSEFIEITLARPLQEDVQQRLAAFVQETLGQERRSLLVALLQGPGVRVSHISRLLVGGAGEFGAALGLLAVLVARGLGAQPVTLGAARCEGFWTLNPHLLVEFTKRPSSRSKGASKQPIVSITPTLDPILQEWLNVQEGQASMGKKCPKVSDKQQRRRR